MPRSCWILLVVLGACTPPISVEQSVAASVRTAPAVQDTLTSRRTRAPNDLVFDNGIAAPGPELYVHVESLSDGRLRFDITRGNRQYQAIVEREQASHFHVISQGGDGLRGRDGFSGRDGFQGSPGTSAICPSFQGGMGGRGEDGSPGDDGSAGGDGGDGGNVLVEIVTNGASASELVALVQKMVLSRGGSGGPGGSGGRGGRGGAGGSGGASTTCVGSDGATTFLSAGQQGFSGIDGRSGFDGRSGWDGHAGRVTIRVIE